MPIGRADDPENPSHAMAHEAATLLGTGSRNPSGPAAKQPRQKAGHMAALDPHAQLRQNLLPQPGRPHMHEVLATGFSLEARMLGLVGVWCSLGIHTCNHKARQGGLE